MAKDPLHGFRILAANECPEGGYRVILQLAEDIDPTALPVIVFADSDDAKDLRAALAMAY